LHYLHMSDWNHPSLKGSYLMACVIYSAVFQESTVRNPYHAGIPDEEAEFFQSVASDTVLNKLELWNIAPLVVIDEKPSLQNKIQLYQNYPNPVKNNTRISYSIPEPFPVTIKVYDILGNLVTTLADEYHQQGNYEIEFDAATLTSGIYFIKMIAGQYCQTRIMILD